MNLSEFDINLIEKYIQNRLSEKEQIVFEERLLDLEFKEELALQKSLKNASIAFKRKEIREKFQSWDQEELKETRGNILRRIPVWSGAAVILILIGVLFTLFINQPSSEYLYQKYEEPFPNLIDPIEKGSSNNELSLSRLYELKSYQKVIDQPPANQEENLYFALSWVAMEKPEEAIPILEPLAKDQTYRFWEAAQWYLAISYGLTGNETKSKLLLHEIAENSSHDFQNQAQRLLADLN